MADLPITSDEGAMPIVINDPTTTANVANVKAGSTASVAGDNSLVVALSPNSPLPTGTNKIGQTGVAQGSTTSGENGNLVQGAVTTASPAYTTAQTSPLSLDTTGNLRVALAKEPLASVITTGSLSTVGTTAVQMHSGSIVATIGITVRSSPSNTAIIYIGTSTVTANTAAATDGMPLKIGESITLAITNINLIYLIATAASQEVFWIVL